MRTLIEPRGAIRVAEAIAAAAERTKALPRLARN